MTDFVDIGGARISEKLWRHTTMYGSGFQSMKDKTAKIGTSSPISIETRILLSNLWVLPTHLRHHLSFEQHIKIKLSTFLDLIEQDPSESWRDQFCCTPAQRQWTPKKASDDINFKQRFAVYYHRCSREYLEDIADSYDGTIPSPTCSLIIRVNYSQQFYACLVRYNEPGFQPHGQWIEFLKFAGLKTTDYGDE